MLSASDIAGALARAGVDRLPPPARAYLAERLVAAGAAGTLSPSNLGGLRNVSFGSAREGSTVLASFPDIDAAARAIVAVSYRAAPREWAETDAETMARLGAYPIHRRGAVALAGAPVGDAADIAKSALKSALGPATMITDFFGPSAESEATFRGLVADWEGYERILKAQPDIAIRLPELKDDVSEWRKFRDAWKAGTIPGNELGGLLNVQVSLSNKVRTLLKEKGVTDPVLQQKRAGVDVEKSTDALAASKDVDTWAKSVPILDWLTDPSQSPKAAGSRAGIVAGVGLAVAALLSLFFYSRSAKMVTGIAVSR